MASLTESLRLVISGDSSGATSALRSVRDDMGKTEAAAGTWGQKMNTAANYAAAGVVALSAAIVTATKATIDYGENVDAISDISNLGAGGSSRLAGQFKAFGVEAETGAKGVRFFEKSVYAARQGNEAMIESFGRLGISAGELRSLTDADLLGKVRDGLAGTADATSQANIAMQLFGKSGADLADWYAAAPDDMAKVNEQLEKAGLVWDDKDVRTWQDVIDAQREMKIQWLGLQITITRDVMPALRPLISAFVSLLQALRPLMPLLVPLTAALAVFVGVVKTARAASAAWSAVMRLLPGRIAATTEATTTNAAATKVSTAATKGSTVALRAGLVTLGLYAAAIAAAAAAIYGIVKAYQSWRSAADDAAAAAAGAQATLDKNAAKLGPEMTAQLQSQINADKYQSPDGILGWLKAAFLAQFSEQGWMRGFGLFADGGTVTRPTLALIGEGGESEDIVPASKRVAYARGILGGGRMVKAEFNNCTFSATSPRELADMLGREATLALGGLA